MSIQPDGTSRSQVPASLSRADPEPALAELDTAELTVVGALAASRDATERDLRRMSLLQQRAIRRSAHNHITDLDLALRLPSARDRTERLAADGRGQT